jgi:hypothetical protein
LEELFYKNGALIAIEVALALNGFTGAAVAQRQTNESVNLYSSISL